MSITSVGLEGEKLARLILKNNIKNISNLFQADWIYKQNGKYYIVEVKNKQMFLSPPFDGYGLNLYQFKSRLDFQKVTGVRCLFLCINTCDNLVHYNWIDNLNKLDKKDKFITKNQIIIFNLDKFYKIKLEKMI